MIPPFLLSLAGSCAFWIALAFVGVSGWGWVQTWRLSDAKKEIVAAQHEIAGLTTQRDLAVAAGQACSKSVQDLKSSADRRIKTSQDALAKARRGNVTLLDQIARRDAILASAKGRPVGTCDAGKALAEIRGQK
jgi:hypothetical protein